MKTLILDTSSERCLFSLWMDGCEVVTRPLPKGYQSSKFLMPLLQETLQQQDLSVKDFGDIIVGVGPGSYTGIRVGVTVAKALSYSLKIPLIGVTSLKAFIPETDGTFASIVDAKIGGAYIVTGCRSGNDITYDTEPVLVAQEDIAGCLQGISMAVSPDVLPLQKRLQNASLQWIERDPSTAQLYRLGQERRRRGCFTVDGSVDILYLRKTQAELEAARVGHRT